MFHGGGRRFAAESPQMEPIMFFAVEKQTQVSQLCQCPEFCLKNNITADMSTAMLHYYGVYLPNQPLRG